MKIGPSCFRIPQMARQLEDIAPLPTTAPDSLVLSVGTRSSKVAEGAERRQRDFLLAGVLVGTRILPPPAGLVVGLGTTALTSITGLGAMREGARHGRPREVLDGAAHLATACLIGAAVIGGRSSLGDQAVSAGFTVLGTKQLWDRPLSTTWELGREAVSLTRDAMRVLEPEPPRASASADRRGADAAPKPIARGGWESSIWDME